MVTVTVHEAAHATHPDEAPPLRSSTQRPAFGRSAARGPNMVSHSDAAPPHAAAHHGYDSPHLAVNVPRRTRSTAVAPSHSSHPQRARQRATRSAHDRPQQSGSGARATIRSPVRGQKYTPGRRSATVSSRRSHHRHARWYQRGRRPPLSGLISSP